ncbi:MAG: glycosyltransferase family 4 protein [Blastochloris sp.]|nr:glycosyltransferase family 4 protein [Blastochloris sp.]
MRKAHPNVHYVAVTANRQKEINLSLGVRIEEISVIENGVAHHELWGLEPEFYQWLEARDFIRRDIVFYYPTKLMQRKNIDQAILFIDAIKKSGLQPMLIVTGSQDVYGTAGQAYEDYLKNYPKQLGLEKDVFFLNDFNDEIGQVWSQAFRAADVLLFPSAYEGHGIPPVEAALCRLPCWTLPLPTLAEWQLPSLTMVKTPAEAVKAAHSLMLNPIHLARKEALRNHNWQQIHQQKIIPLLNALITF